MYYNHSRVEEAPPLAENPYISQNEAPSHSSFKLISSDSADWRRLFATCRCGFIQIKSLEYSA